MLWPMKHRLSSNKESDQWLGALLFQPKKQARGLVYDHIVYIYPEEKSIAVVARGFSL